MSERLAVLRRRFQCPVVEWEMSDVEVRGFGLSWLELAGIGWSRLEGNVI